MARHSRRGSIPSEYTLLASIMAFSAALAVQLPSAVSDLMLEAGANMEAPADAATAVTPGEGRNQNSNNNGQGSNNWDDAWSAGNGNQGVGNGEEGADPGNSNQGDPARSNDENGGTPGNPGRQGGNN